MPSTRSYSVRSARKSNASCAKDHFHRVSASGCRRLTLHQTGSSKDMNHAYVTLRARRVCPRAVVRLHAVPRARVRPSYNTLSQIAPHYTATRQARLPHPTAPRLSDTFGRHYSRHTVTPRHRHHDRHPIGPPLGHPHAAMLRASVQLHLPLPYRSYSYMVKP